MKLAIDTNIFVYAEGVNSPAQAVEARKLIAGLPAEMIVVPVQVLGELFNVLTRKGKFAPRRAAAVVADLSTAFPTADTSAVELAAGLELAERHDMNIWDAVILSASASAGCSILLSEDMQHGFTWHGVTVVNPFLEVPHPLLRRALSNR